MPIKGVFTRGKQKYTLTIFSSKKILSNIKTEHL